MSVSVFRTNGQSGSFCVQWGKVRDRDGPGQVCSCQSSWSQCVQQVDALQDEPDSAEEAHVVVFMVLVVLMCQCSF